MSERQVGEGETRPSLLRQGTMPEWAGFILLAVSLVWGASQVVFGLESRMALSDRTAREQFQAVSNGLEKLQISVDTQTRINALERTSELAKFESVLAESVGRIARLYENIDIAWDHIRENEGKLRQLREEMAKLETEHKATKYDPTVNR